MDVKPGHCSRCDKPLPEDFVRCEHCPKAVYCSDPCRMQDRVRHGAVECPMFGTKCCSHCKKTGNLKQCTGCNNAWYCDANCQKRNRAAHKETCHDIQEFIKARAPQLTTLYMTFATQDVSHSWERFLEPPFYFGSTMAHDFLQLQDNEWADEVTDEETARDYCILTAGCGDLRNTVLTAASLPAKYQGKLHIVLNDLDPYIMARNVLFLSMLIQNAGKDGITSSIATIWYSLHISKKDYNLIKTSLRTLIQANAKSLQDITRGSVTVSDEDLAKLRKVWKGWYSLECERIKRSSINLSRQREATFAEILFFKEQLQLYLERLTPVEADSMKKWFQHGLFLPNDIPASGLLFDNPTLTGGRERLEGPRMTPTETFEYSIHPHLTPFKAWDCLQVRESVGRATSSPIIMYHKYLAKLLREMTALLTQDRLHVHLLVSSCLEIPHHHQALKMAKFDRIFTSNLADFVGFRKLLHAYKPLLNPENKNAVIVTETITWIAFRPEANVWDLNSGRDINESTKTTMQLCKDDTGKALSSPLDLGKQLEYFNNTHWFAAYLRASMMAGCLLIPELDHAPSLKEAIKCEGLQMRDFREELNKLVPFQFRVNARSLTSPAAADRAVEWYIPTADAR